MPVPESTQRQRWQRMTCPFGSAIALDCLEIITDFRGKRVSLLSPGSSDRFSAHDVQSSCDRHPNTLTVIKEMDRHIFSGFRKPLAPSIRSSAIVLTNLISKHSIG
jgi:hypothetical protein